ncbi:putative amidoligase enzyme-domain-containing protein [Jackrogersella minutella]|nr:putative amidoligase enzyme-domain-containing protein [Jackrogersella minutella]
MSYYTQTWLQSGARSFGVEFEVIVPWVWDDEKDPHEEFADKLSPILRVPSSLKETLADERQSMMGNIRIYIYSQFVEAFRAHGLPVFDVETAWEIKPDVSLSAPRRDFKWVDMEIISPAERASPEAFQAIRHAMSLLTSTYRMIVNNTCGLHVHVGDGPELMPLQHVKRVIGLIWAADPLLSRLHPPHRRGTYYAPSIRERSNLAHGSNAEQTGLHRTERNCYRYIGDELRHGELPISWREENQEEHQIEAYEKTREPGHFEPFVWKDSDDEVREVEGEKMHSSPLDPISGAADNSGINIHAKKYMASIRNGYVYSNAPYVSIRSRTIPRVTHPVLTAEEINIPGLDMKAFDYSGVFAGVEEIFVSESSCILAWLLGPVERPNYNIGMYRCYWLQDRDGRPGTIEFREAAGTVDAQWAEIWARICVGLTDFAIHAPVNVYLDVLSNIDSAEAGGAPYDVLDLLEQVGLFAEAEFAEKRLIKNREAWELEFIPNAES